MQNLLSCLTEKELYYTKRRCRYTDQDFECGLMQSVLEKACADALFILYGAKVMCLYPQECLQIKIFKSGDNYCYFAENPAQVFIMNGIPNNQKTPAIEAVLKLLQESKAA